MDVMWFCRTNIIWFRSQLSKTRDELAHKVPLASLKGEKKPVHRISINSLKAALEHE
jgi:hypothetical protein